MVVDEGFGFSSGSGVRVGRRSLEEELSDSRFKEPTDEV
jgi:hypothetical protein